jgi:hypothetical protein
MANPIVKCTVDQCTHYMPGDQCMAAKVSIYNEEATGTSKKPKDTQCKSFHDRKTMGDMLGAFHNANIGGTLSATFMDGTQITPAVECFVSNCNYWHDNNECTASHIDVFGSNAAKTDDTDCNTFEKRK